ncbi:conserved protein of unknown function [Candidatus Hydrogenisulfobacillus filiaventi]|uniref:Uncharacterized protein n=1 Tax=Candidatus Hydrogenisulfobacillus filiaventi TaxID=2707344 RepID=A0A6F8ZE63_9FIRM|nr:DUF523 domain-containing protein [Bacillota bacterium]CAB1128057.1 conserved protein of unknown function [Candidatus Hydrogenisulfobacillus filiaventi]
MADGGGQPRYLVSACLAGMRVRYDGRDSAAVAWLTAVSRGQAIPLCPEVLGGLDIPREPAEIVGGTGEDVLEGRARVQTQSGRDVTGAFLEGAFRVLGAARALGVTAAVLKSRSPSCGCTAIYDGSFSGRLRPGAGVLAALLQREGIVVQEGEADPPSATASEPRPEA